MRTHERRVCRHDAFIEFVGQPVADDNDPVEYTVDFCRVLAGGRFPFDEQEWRQLAAADIERGTNLGSSHGMIPMSSPSRIGELTAIDVSTLVVHGSDDPLFPPDHAEVIAKAIPGARLVLSDGIGHDTPTPYVPELAETIIDFLRTAD